MRANVHSTSERVNWVGVVGEVGWRNGQLDRVGEAGDRIGLAKRAVGAEGRSGRSERVVE